MSYSFSFTAINKAQAVEKLDAELGKVLAGQPHETPSTDRARAAVVDVLDATGEPAEDKTIAVSVHGSVGTGSYVGLGFGVSVSHHQRPKVE